MDEAKRAAIAAERKAKKEASEADLVKFLEKFKSESERGVALAVCARLDVKIEEFLRETMVNDPKHVDSVFKPDAPLGSFGTRSRLCFLLGYITEVTYKDLKTIGDIRNEFAHKMEINSFNINSIKNKCLTLQIHTSPEKFFDAMGTGEAEHQMKFYDDFGYDLKEPRWAFVAATGFLGVLAQTQQATTSSGRIPTLTTRASAESVHQNNG